MISLAQINIYFESITSQSLTIMVVNVLIAEDSSYQRKIISDMLSEHPKIEIIDIARDGEEAIDKIEKSNPDVLLLDLIMPKMDGLTLFRYLSKHYPVPTIIFSALDPQQASKELNDSIEALILGAFDYIIKPSGIWKDEFPKFKDQLINKVLLASEIKIQKELLKDKLKKEKNTFLKPKSIYNLGGKIRKEFSDAQPVDKNKLKTGVIVVALTHFSIAAFEYSDEARFKITLALWVFSSSFKFSAIRVPQ